MTEVPEASNPHEPAAGSAEPGIASRFGFDLTEDGARRVPSFLRRTIIFALLAWVVVSWGRAWLHQLGSLIFMLFLAWLLAVTLEPAVAALSRRGIRRGLGTGITMGGGILTMIVFISLFGGLLIDQIVQLIQGLPDFVTSAIGWINNTFNSNIDPTKIQSEFSLDTTKIAELATNLGLGVLSLLASAIGTVFQVLTLLLFAFYFSAEAPKFQRTVASLFPPGQQRIVLTIWQTSQAKAGGYVISRLVLAIISGVVTAGFLYLLDIPYWLPLALWVGILSQFLPTIGTYLAGALPVLVGLSVSSTKGLIVLGLIIAYQQVENYVLSPRVSARAMAVHPAVSFGSVIAGGLLAGAMGALIAIPVAAVLTALWETYGHRYELIPELAAAHPHHVAVLSTPPAESGRDR